MSLAGDLDLVVGDSGDLLNYFENTWTSTTPVFVQRTESANPFNGIDVGWGDSAEESNPALGDLDGDGTLRPCPSIDCDIACFLSLAGDLDLVVGEWGGLLYFENTGTSTAPVFVARTGSANPFDGINAQNSAPALGDIDGDGTLKRRP